MIEKVRHSITRRLTLSLVATVLAVSLVAVITAHRVVSELERASLESRADQTLSYLVGVLDAPLSAVDDSAVKTIGAAVSQDRSMLALTIRNEAGAVLYAVDRQPDSAPIRRSAMVVHRGGDQERTVGEVSFALSTSAFGAANQRLLGSWLLSVFLILTAIVAVTAFYVRTALSRPVRRLNEIVAGFGAGQYATDHSMPYLEFQPFGDALARMAKEIEGQIRRVHEAEAKYRSIVENAIEGIFQTTMDGRLVKVNPALAKGFGCESVEDFMAYTHGESVSLYVDPRQRQEFVALLLEQGFVSTFEVELRRRDGRTIGVSMSARLVRDEQGAPCLIEGFLNDVTDRKRAEAKLTRLNRELRAISDCNQFLMRAENEADLLLNVCRVVVDGAGYAMARVGYPDEGGAVRSAAGFGSGDEPSVAAPEPEWFAMPGDGIACVQDIAAEEGSGAWREAAVLRGYRATVVLPLKDERGRAFGALQIFATEPHAITPDEMRLLEELANDLAFGIVALRTREERDRIAKIDMARLRLIRFAATHTLDELLEETLNEAEKLSGSLIGFYHFLEDDQKTLSLQNWSTRTKAKFCKAEGKGLHYDVAQAGVWADCIRERRPLIHNDYNAVPGRKGLPELHAAVHRELVVPVFRGEKIMAILGVGNKETEYTQRDVEAVGALADQAWEIAERKGAEEKLRHYRDQLEETIEQRTAELLLARNAAEAANKAKSMFLANMSHELRTPLNAILGFSSLMRRDPGLGPGQRANLDIINRSGEHLLTLINDVLEMAKIEAGRLQLEVAPFDLGNMVRDVSEMMALRAKEKGLADARPGVGIPALHQGRRSAFAPDTHQSGEQCREVHRRGRRGHPAGRSARRAGPSADRGRGQRPRHRQRRPAAPVPAFHPVGGFRFAARHGTRSRHHSAVRSFDGWHHKPR